ncbi:hypothetical protein [Sneathiella limimaris]|uniref:hypothetical protein n=1 Tax=Sneathiella limimaris TaxID=1964213 RepID=UPI00146F5C01|nr:hypothetical protein [Sneathiella limimaris]
MLSASIGAQSAAAQYQAPETKPAGIQEELSNVEGTNPEVTSENSAPAVPATNSAPISVDAVTALQQVEAEAAPETQRGADPATAATTGPTEVGTPPAEEAGVEAAAQQVQQLEEEGNQSRANSENTVAASEDTDTAGRSARNPIDLQI